VSISFILNAMVFHAFQPCHGSSLVGHHGLQLWSGA
jgi:hypothetical protein